MAQLTELSSLFLFVLRGCSYHIYQKMNMQVTDSIGDKGKIAAGSSSQGCSLWQFTQTGPREGKWFIRIHALPSALLEMCSIFEPVCFPRGDFQAFNLPWISPGLCFSVWEGAQGLAFLPGRGTIPNAL